MTGNSDSPLENQRRWRSEDRHPCLSRPAGFQPVDCSQRSRKIAVILIIATIFGLLGFILFGCTQNTAIAPSTSSAAAHVDTARAAVTTAETLSQRIHDKDVLIDRWRQSQGQ